MRFAYGSRWVILQSPPGGRNSTELLNLTITEISSTKPRRANRNSQGSQRSWTQGAKSKKMTERSQITSHPIIDRSINRSINESTSSQVETSNKNRWAKRHMENDLANGKTIKQATRHTIVNSTKSTVMAKKKTPSVTKQDNVINTIHGQPDSSAQKETKKHREIKTKNKNHRIKNLVAAKHKIISRRAE